MSVQYYRHDEDIGIKTDATDERDFHGQFSKLLADVVDGLSPVEAKDEIENLLPHFLEICLGFRGYKTANLLMKTTYFSGVYWPQSPPICQVFDSFAMHTTVETGIQKIEDGAITAIPLQEEDE